MRLIIVSQHFYPDSFRVNDIAFALREAGHEVRVITGLPDYDSGATPPEYRLFKKRGEILGGVRITRVPTARRGRGVFSRMINYASFAVIGSHTPEQISDSMSAADTRLSPEHVRYLESGEGAI